MPFVILIGLLYYNRSWIGNWMLLLLGGGDRRDAYVMSTMHNLSATIVLKQPKDEHEMKPIPCPSAITDYNKWIGGVNF